MATWITVGIVFAIGFYAHYARLKSPLVFVTCLMLLAFGLTIDLMIDQPPSRFAD
ncbi:hypothetical protein [Saliniramus sp.]|uniref:hypothetical protein n=1 Tax=Saliniramus sp. TaxID=2986772 RepID=UPI002CB1C0FC|nr:hypothetical protein [Saliniramus sp.]HMB09613.1 hypothetical protein [Saliniramus sp.]